MKNLTWLLIASVAVWGCDGTAQLVPANEDLPEEGLETPDEAMEVVADAEEEPVAVDCAATDSCTTEPEEPVDATPEPVADAGTPPVVDAGTPLATTLYLTGAKLLVRTWTYLRSTASTSGAIITSIEPSGGVSDSEHGSGMPRGMLSPGQVVVLQSGTQSNGFWKVKYDGAVGFIAASKVAAIDPAAHPVSVALKYRNAFFKHQLHRANWNKDGPYTSGTCAPTSLAMAARIFGHEPMGLSIEQSIHRSRQSYGESSDHVGTNRTQIRTGALNMGLEVATFSTVASTGSMRTRIDGQLAKKRVFVLEGQSGIESTTTPSLYQSAFNKKYAAAGITRRYTFDGRHSIAVFGRDAATGGYVVADPISEVGVVVLTGAELEDFFKRWGGTGNAVW
jgi:hypothetical protein